MLSALVAVFVTLLAIYVFSQWYGNPRRSVEDARNEYIRDYSKRQQVAAGKNCTDLASELKIFLKQDVAPILASRKQGENWSTDKNVQERFDAIRDHLLMCRSLYLEGKNGRLNDLTNVGFAVQIDQDFVTLGMLLKYGAPSQKCDPHCVDAHFLELEKRYKKIWAAVQ